MSHNTGYAAAFIVGTAIGAIAAWQCARRKYEKIAQEEIDSVKEVFARRKAEDLLIKPDRLRQSLEKAPIVVNTPSDYSEYGKIINNEGYLSEPERKEETAMSDVPHVISPDEFGEFEDYDTISLTYYVDGVLTDEMDEIIEDIDELVGLHSLNHFGEYEDDAVFVRNDERSCDYEILLDQRNYSDVVKIPGGMRG